MKKQCIVCKKKHWPLCEIPPGYRRKMREDTKAKKEEAAKAKAAASHKRENTRE